MQQSVLKLWCSPVCSLCWFYTYGGQASSNKSWAKLAVELWLSAMIRGWNKLQSCASWFALWSLLTLTRWLTDKTLLFQYITPVRQAWKRCLSVCLSVLSVCPSIHLSDCKPSHAAQQTACFLQVSSLMPVQLDFHRSFTGTPPHTTLLSLHCVMYTLLWHHCDM